MTDTEQLFKVALDEEMKDVFYFQQICDDKVKNIFKVPWGGALLRNCSSAGQVLSFRTVKEYEKQKKETNRSMWLYLPLKVFRSDGFLFGVYCCPQCESMTGTNKLSVDQDPVQIASRVCIHSKVCSTLLEDWRAVWNIYVAPRDKLVEIVCNVDIKQHTFQQPSKENTLLAAVLAGDDVALLYTVTVRQGTPHCSLCTVRNCRHTISYQDHKDEEESHFLSSLNTDGDEEPVEVAQPAQPAQPAQLLNTGTNMDRSSGSENGSESGSFSESGERGKDSNYWVSAK